MHRRTARIISIVVAMAFSIPILCCSGAKEEDCTWRVYALHYGDTPTFTHRTLVRDAKKGEKVPFAWWAWVLVPGKKGPKDRVILVDTGFEDKKLDKSWRLKRHTPVPKLLKELDLSPADITDVILTHLHWDHAGDTGHYEKAKVWIQRSEMEKASSLVSEERPSRSGFRLKEIEALNEREKGSLLNVVEGEKEVAPGVVLHLGGKHSHGIQWVEVKTGSRNGTVVLASDIAYLFENIDRSVGSRSTGDHEADVAQLKIMKKLATHQELIIPGHDPLVAKRFPKVGKHVYEIRK